jgi:S1-C subfamily serine protease
VGAWRSLCAAGLALACLAPCPAAAQQAPAFSADQAPQPSQDDPRLTPVVRVVRQASPAVVSIVSARQTRPPFEAESLLQRFFGEAASQAPKAKTARNLGSGVVIDGAKGFVLTNAHVIAGATSITARLQDGREYSAALQGADQDMDLAVLRLELEPGAPPLPQARMGDSASLMPGETVVAIGNPYGLSHTVTPGVVSALERRVSPGQQTNARLIQTDAAINPGTPAAAAEPPGRVVGINAAVFAKGGGLGFAIPINKARDVLDELIATGRVAHIWRGLLGEDMGPDQAAYYALPRPGGMIVTDVFPGTPAEKAGILPGDALLALAGQKVRNKAQFLALLLGRPKGEPLDVLLSRADRQFQARMRPQVLDRQAGLGLMAWRWGLSPRTAEKPGIASPAPVLGGAAALAEPGVTVGTVRPNGPAARLGLKPGDVFLWVGSRGTTTEADLLAAFYRYQMHNQLLLSVRRGEQTYTVRLRV